MKKKVFDYPVVRQDDVVEDYHGTAVADPYRWLEDPQAAETQAFVEAQNALTREYLDEIPQREWYAQRLTELWDYPKYSVPHQRGGRYYLSKMEGLQNQPIWYRQQTLEDEPQVVLDPNTLSEDGTVAITHMTFNRDGSLLAYGLSKSGSDWQTVRIRDMESGEDYEEQIEWCKFTAIAWKADNSGFYYSRFPEEGSVPAEEATFHNKLYWHKLGTPQSEDVLVYERPDAPELGFSPVMSDDNRYLVVDVWLGAIAKNQLYYRPLEDENADFVRLIDTADAMFNFVGNDGDLFYVHTDWQAPRGRVVAIDLNHPERENWQDVIPESGDVISFINIVNDQFAIAYMHNAYHQLKLFELDGTFIKEVELPTIGSILEMSGKRPHSELFLSFHSFLYPATILRYDFTADELTIYKQPAVDFDPEQYVTEQVFYPSKDGTQVSMFLTYKKGLVRDGNTPTLLYGYGGFSISLTPAFHLTRLPWLEMGGIYAYANLRGGNEYGDEWHTAGMRENKQNVFDDFAAAAEWLIANDYTRPKKLAIFGGSNGGLLVAATMLQRPDLFGAVLCAVPVIDMLRFHKFTAGRYWTAEYGNAEEEAESFPSMWAYSPLHNVQAGVNYPPVLITTADTDDRVVPLHSYKFAATLQAASTAENPHPILLRVETKAGHGLGKPTAKVIDEAADMFGFLLHLLGD